MVDLRATLNASLRSRYKSKRGIAANAGFDYENGNSQVGRILNGSIARPSWLDLTRLVIAAGMTPNEAASIAGFDIPIRPSDGDAPLSEEERQAVDLFKSVQSREMQQRLLSVLRGVLSFTAEAQEQGVQSPDGTPLTSQDEDATAARER